MDNSVIYNYMKRLTLFSLLISLTLSLFSQGTYVWGLKNRVPVTGQTTSYTTYDDGYYQTGSVSAPRFVNNGNGTITDKVTGLMWIQDPAKIIPGTSVIASNQVQALRGNWAVSTSYAIGDIINDAVGSTGRYVCAVAHTSGTTTLAADISTHSTYWRLTAWAANATASTYNQSPFTWANAISAITTLNGQGYAGYTDWRLPNIQELFTITNLANSSPTTWTTFFTNITDSGPYWSSSTSNSTTTSAKTLDFAGCYVSNTAKTTATLYVMIVRGGK